METLGSSDESDIEFSTSPFNEPGAAADNEIPNKQSDDKSQATPEIHGVFPEEEMPISSSFKATRDDENSIDMPDELSLNSKAQRELQRHQEMKKRAQQAGGLGLGGLLSLLPKFAGKRNSLPKDGLLHNLITNNNTIREATFKLTTYKNDMLISRENYHKILQSKGIDIERVLKQRDNPSDSSVRQWANDSDVQKAMIDMTAKHNRLANHVTSLNELRPQFDSKVVGKETKEAFSSAIDDARNSLKNDKDLPILSKGKVDSFNDHLDSLREKLSDIARLLIEKIASIFRPGK